MKIIHCADLHIDSNKFSKFSPEKRALKRHQILQNFVDMVDFAEKNKVTAIMLCGDVFDEKKVLKKTLKTVQEVIENHKDITFFYIWGNHDEGFTIFDKYPSNFVVFGNDFSKIDFGEVCIGGVSFQRNLPSDFYDSINFQKSDFNIMMMHGPVLTGDKYSEPIQLKRLDDKFIDYLQRHPEIDDRLYPYYISRVSNIYFGNTDFLGGDWENWHGGEFADQDIPEKYKYGIDTKYSVYNLSMKDLRDIINYHDYKRDIRIQKIMDR